MTAVHDQERAAAAGHADPDVNVLIVGAGFSGIGVAIALDRAGLHDWRILDNGSGGGGTWHRNTYPGVAVDIPSFSYQFSFAQRTDWTRTYAGGSELTSYAEGLLDEYALRDRIRFNTHVERADYDADRRRWTVALQDGTALTARFLINASGVLTLPKKPDIPGVDAFAGTVMHTARWDHDVDLRGKRVAIIGTGASAVQVIPQIAADVAELTVFQRTPIWCFPKLDLPLPAAARRALRLPAVSRAARLASQLYVELLFPISAHYYSVLPLAKYGERYGRRYLRGQVRDPQTRSRLTPQYGLGCKRPSFHNRYLATYNRDNVHLITEPITHVDDTAVHTADGVAHEIDVLILATGFKVLDTDTIPTFGLTGPDGETLGERWDRLRLHAYEGVSIPHFPNFFTVFGPYGYNGSSYFSLVEAQARHIVRTLSTAHRKRATEVEIDQAASDRYFQRMQRKRHRQVFWRDSCASANSYYFDKHGDVGLRPTTTLSSWLRSKTFPVTDYVFR